VEAYAGLNKTNSLVCMSMMSEKSRLTSEKYRLPLSFSISPQILNTKFVTGMGIWAFLNVTHV
jgi:hypothetical protein